MESSNARFVMSNRYSELAFGLIPSSKTTAVAQIAIKDTSSATVAVVLDASDEDVSKFEWDSIKICLGRCGYRK
jgi:hypothetical protein